MIRGMVRYGYAGIQSLARLWAGVCARQRLRARTRSALILAALLASGPAQAIVLSYTLVQNDANSSVGAVRTTEYPDGDASTTPPADNGEFQFVSSSQTVAENQTIEVCIAERVNGSDAAVSVDITDDATGACSSGSDYNAVADATVNWADTVEGSATGITLTLNDVSANCDIDFSFTNDTGGIESSGSQQTCEVTVQDEASAAVAFPGAEGFAAQTQHARDASSQVIRVTNTNDSGAGSLRAALTTSGPRYIVFTLGGTFQLSSQIELGAAHSQVYLACHTAPADSGGVQITASSSMNEGLLQLSHYRSGDPTGAFHDGVFRYCKFRHGSLGPNEAAHDNIQLFAGTNNVIFDHNSIQGTGDEEWSFWLSGNGGSTIHDVTFSRNLWGEGAGGPNMGPLMSGASGVGPSIYNISYHRNLTVHTSYRDYKQDTGSGGIKATHTGANNEPFLTDSGASWVPTAYVGAPIYNITDGSYGIISSNTATTVTATLTGGTQNDWDTGDTYIIANRGTIFINNVHYNDYTQAHSIGQNYYSGCSAIVFDIINDYFRAGPNYTAGVWPLTISRGATHTPPSGCPAHSSASVHFVGSTSRKQDGTSTLKDSASNNYAMVKEQFGTETWHSRTAEILTQPSVAITRISAAAAYTDLVTNENVGANVPSQDSVDARLIGDAKGGDSCTVAQCGYVSSNAVGNNGWPSLATGTAWTDTDGDGVPDAYESGTLGTNPAVSENQATTDSDSDGIPNIEEWINSLE